MARDIIWGLAATAAVLIVIFGGLALALHGRAEKWAILGVCASVMGLMVGIGGIIVPYFQKTHTGKAPAAVSSHGSGSLGMPEAGQANPIPSPAVTSLPYNSSLRKKILDMNEVCGDLGVSQHAWLPGQSSAQDIAGRVILAPGAAYTWSCEENGSRLTRAQITQGCQIWYPGTQAFTWDPNNAYSWVCI
jgi:hypothetical protein